MQIKNKLVKLRKKNKLTIEQLSQKLNVRKKTIINWENGKSIPNIKNLQELSDVYNIKITSLVNENDIVRDLICQKKIDYVQTLFLFLFFIIILILTSIFVHRERYQEMEVYTFSGNGELFSFSKGIAIFSRDNRLIDISGFKVNDDTELKNLTINIAFNESIWAVKDYDESDLSVSEWIKTVNFEEYGIKGELFGIKKADSFVNYATKFPKDFKVEINYCTEDNCSVEILDIKSNKLEPDNELKK